MAKSNRNSDRRRLPRTASQAKREKLAIHERAQTYIRALRSRVESRTDLFLRLRTEPPRVIVHVLTYARNSAPRSFRTLCGVQHPASYADYESKIAAPFSFALVDELRWSICVLCTLSDKVGEFAKAKTDFETALVTSRISDAEIALEQCVRHIGMAVWTLEAGIQLADARGGIEDNRRFLSDARRTIQDPIASAIGEFASERATGSFSGLAFEDAWTDFFKQSKRQQSASASYVGIHVLPFQTRLPDKTYAGMLALDSTYSVANRYLTVRRILAHLAASSTGLEVLSAVAPALKELAVALGDPQLASLYTYVTHIPLRTAESPVREALIQCIEAYTVGQYEKSLELCANAIVVDPLAFEFYELYAK